MEEELAKSKELVARLSKQMNQHNIPNMLEDDDSEEELVASPAAKKKKLITSKDLGDQFETESLSGGIDSSKFLYAPAKPAYEVNDDASLFKSKDMVQAAKMAAALLEKVDEGESIQVKAGSVIASTTVDMRIKHLIWEGGYFELGLLAPSCDVKFSDVKSGVARANNKVKPPANIEEWRHLFLTYAIIYTSRFILAAPEMFGYIQRIYGLYYKYKNTFIWRLYDEEFRRFKAANPLTPWHKRHLETLWEVEEIQSRNQAKSNQFNQKSGSDKKTSVKLPRNGTCHAWNTKGCKAGTKCIFTHGCCYCKKDHKYDACPDKK